MCTVCRSPIIDPGGWTKELRVETHGDNLFKQASLVKRASTSRDHGPLLLRRNVCIWKLVTSKSMHKWLDAFIVKGSGHGWP